MATLEQVNANRKTRLEALKAKKQSSDNSKNVRKHFHFVFIFSVFLLLFCLHISMN